MCKTGRLIRVKSTLGQLNFFHINEKFQKFYKSFQFPVSSFQPQTVYREWTRFERSDSLPSSRIKPLKALAAKGRKRRKGGLGCVFEMSPKRQEQAGGLPASSRWLSEVRATPPVTGFLLLCILKGCQPIYALLSLASFRDALFFNLFSGGVASLNHRLQALMPPA